MESVYFDQSVIDIPPSSKRCKLENDSLPPSIDASNVVELCPIMTLPIELLAKIIGNHVHIAQWHVLELVDKTFFREATLLAWRQLRHADLDEFKIVSKKRTGEPCLERQIRSIGSILEKLNNRSPFLTSLRGVSMQSDCLGLNSMTIVRLTRFEHLESIGLGDGEPFTCYVESPGCSLQDLNFFLEATRSRATLKSMNIECCCAALSSEETWGTRSEEDVFRRRFSELIADDRGMLVPLKLEKLSIDLSWKPKPILNFEFMDMSRMTELRFGTSEIKPVQLTLMISRAENLERLSFAFLHCTNGEDTNCGGNGLRDNTNLLIALASREKLASLEFASDGRQRYEGVQGPFHQGLFQFVPPPFNHAQCMRFEPQFLHMLKALGRREHFDKLKFARGFISPKFNSSELVATISEHMPRLRSLTMPVDDFHLKAIVKMEHMEEIDLGYKGDCRKLYEITDGVFAQIGLHQRLKRISIDGFAREDERPLTELGKVPTLTDVRIRRVDLVLKEDFVSWSEGHVSNLETLMLTGIGVLDTDAEVGLIALIKKTPRLRMFTAEGVVTDRLLRAIAEYCPKMESLDVTSRGNELSVGALQMVVDRCPKLKEFGGMKYKLRKQLMFPKYWKMGGFCEYDEDDVESDAEDD